MSLEFSAEYDWAPIITESGKQFDYPHSLGSRVKAEYNRPGIYRWRVLDSGKLSAVTIAEADNLTRAIAQFNEPAAPPLINRVKSVLSEHVFRGSEIYMDALVLKTVKIGGETLGPDSAREQDIRKLLEILLIREALKSGTRLLSTVQAKPSLGF